MTALTAFSTHAARPAAHRSPIKLAPAGTTVALMVGLGR